MESTWEEISNLITSLTFSLQPSPSSEGMCSKFPLSSVVSHTHTQLPFRESRQKSIAALGHWRGREGKERTRIDMVSNGCPPRCMGSYTCRHVRRSWVIEREQAGVVLNRGEDGRAKEGSVAWRGSIKTREPKEWEGKSIWADRCVRKEEKMKRIQTGREEEKCCWWRRGGRAETFLKVALRWWIVWAVWQDHPPGEERRRNEKWR